MLLIRELYFENHWFRQSSKKWGKDKQYQLSGLAMLAWNKGTSMGSGWGGSELEIQPQLHLLSPQGHLNIREGPPVCILSSQKGPFVKCFPVGVSAQRHHFFWNLQGVNQRLEATCKAGHVRGKWMWLRAPRMKQWDEAMIPDFRLWSTSSKSLHPFPHTDGF